MSKLRKEDFKPIFARWSVIRNQLEILYKEREKDTHDLMERGIELLSELFVMAEGTYPLNYEERFIFVQKNYKSYAAFRQLDELFKETEKKLARRFIMESRMP